MLSEAEVIRIVREHFEKLFPKVCPNCHRHFATLREYILATKRIGKPHSYDAEAGDWNTPVPVGTLTDANCPCGSTLTLSTEGMPLPRRLQLLDWVQFETKRQGVDSSELLDHLRDVVRQQVLADDAAP